MTGTNESLITEKVDQAIALLDEMGVDAWLTFVRESNANTDPAVSLILDQNLTWQSALILTRSGRRVAIVGRFEDEAVRASGAWTEVVPYVEGIGEPLREVLAEIDPQRLAINFSKDDVLADGLSYGMYQVLLEHLEGTPFGGRLVSADGLLAALRSRKTPAEIERLGAAIAHGDAIFEEVGHFARIGRTEAEISRFMKEHAKERGLGLAWEPAMCPIVNSGPASMLGHGIPSESIQLEAGHILHIDFGVVFGGYCSDIQRCWYIPHAHESAPPPRVQEAFDTVVVSIEAGREVLRPGAICWEVDAASRTALNEAGFPEYQHATGHNVGRFAHDGGGTLGPRWPRYGNTPERKVEIGNVFTLEPSIMQVGAHGALGLEEMVLVTESGASYLSDPQKRLPLLGQASQADA